MSEKFLSISELNSYIKEVINAGFPQTLWICGEIQGYDRNKDKRHVFFDLVEKDSASNDVKARIGAVIFERRKLHIENILRQSENAFQLKDDIEVKLACRIDFYEPHGAMRLTVESIDPVYTLGKIAQQRQRLITKLKGEGVFEKNKQKDLAVVPLNIGLITSDDSAAFNDFISELNRSGFGFQIHLRNTLMQGKNAEADIIVALDKLAKIKNLDAVVITRGGGSISDLSCFDSEKIAYRVAEYHIPVLSGIGHEINTTITDLTACFYAKTPTAIAQYLSERVASFLDTLDRSEQKVQEGAENLITLRKNQLKDLTYSLKSSSYEFFKNQNEWLVRMKEVFTSRPVQVLKESKGRLNQNQLRLIQLASAMLRNQKQNVLGIEKVVAMVDPKKTLQRGFSITRKKGGGLIKNNGEVMSGDMIETELLDGKVLSKVS